GTPAVQEGWLRVCNSMLRHNRGMPDFGPARHLPAHHHTRARWHNGAGWTRRILRLPAGDGWALSLSIADIQVAAAHACRPGVQREQGLLPGGGRRRAFAAGAVAAE